MTILDRIRTALEPKTAVPEEVEHQLRLATGALLLEMCRADFTVHHRERRSIAGSVQRAFGLSNAETRELIEDAEADSECAVSLQIYTSLIKEYSTHAQKIELVRDLWRVAYADGVLHNLEERLVRRIAGLIELSDRQVDRLRTQIEAEPVG